MSQINDIFAVLGLSTFGFQVATSLYQLGLEVIAVDHDQTIIQKISPRVSKAYCADVLNAETMKHIGIHNVDVAIIGLRQAFDSTVLLIHQLKKNSNIKKIIALVDNMQKAEVLKILGVHKIIFPEKDSADRLVKQLTMPEFVEMISMTPETDIYEVPCPGEFVDNSLIDLKIRQRFNIYVIGIIRKKKDKDFKETIVAPPPDTKFEVDDKIVILGKVKNLMAFTRAYKL